MGGLRKECLSRPLSRPSLEAERPTFFDFAADLLDKVRKAGGLEIKRKVVRGLLADRVKGLSVEEALDELDGVYKLTGWLTQDSLVGKLDKDGLSDLSVSLDDWRAVGQETFVLTREICRRDRESKRWWVGGDWGSRGDRGY